MGAVFRQGEHWGEQWGEQWHEKVEEVAGWRELSGIGCLLKHTLVGGLRCDVIDWLDQSPPGHFVQQENTPHSLYPATVSLIGRADRGGRGRELTDITVPAARRQVCDGHMT